MDANSYKVHEMKHDQSFGVFRPFKALSWATLDCSTIEPWREKCFTAQPPKMILPLEINESKG